MSATFGQPIQGTTSTTSSDQPQSANGSGGSDQPQDTLDINDPVFASEPLDVNLDGDAYAQPAPPPDGKYRAKLKHAQPKNSAGQPVDFLPGKWGKNQQAVLYTGVRAEILDPSGKYDGIPVFDQSVSTFLGRDGSHKIQSILRVLKKPDGTPYLTPGLRLTTRGWMDLLLQALRTEPECGIETHWGWSCQQCGEEAEKRGERRPREVIGMQKFPQQRDATGRVTYQPERECPISKAHGWSRAQVRIARFLPVGELKS